MNTSEPLRPPAVPLVCHDPYFSIWSPHDRLTDGHTCHWTGRPQPLVCIARVDGHPFRLMGAASGGISAARQLSLEVRPTTTRYLFEADGVRFTLEFLTPALPHDLDLLSRPVTYLTWEARVPRGPTRQIEIGFAAQSTLAVENETQSVQSSRFRLPGTSLLRVGSSEQRVLGSSGDDLRIDWGYLCLAVPEQPGASDALLDMAAFQRQFSTRGSLPRADDLRPSAPVRDGYPVLACCFDLGRVTPGRPASRHALLAYDDLFGIEFLHRRLRAWWRRDGMTFGAMLQQAAADYPRLRRACARFDRTLQADLTASGGRPYEQLCSLAFRQSLAAHKLVADLDGTPLFFSKENFSNGCIATVDVTYPSAPLYLLLNPALLRGMLKPILDYAASPRWKFPFAPHDLGTYPLANGQVYGGGERTEEDQMPVEECGNMLILVEAVAHAEGNAEWARGYWPLLLTWARYLAARGFDPADQLCTDDFAGHLAHNVNLSAKAILALACFARLAGRLGFAAEQGRYRALAERLARSWVRAAAAPSGTRLAFDQPASWSQKYNLVWDRVLELGLFPKSVARREVEHYLRHNTPLGVPLDNRKSYTKNDWSIWSATLADREEDFRALLAPHWRWAHTSAARAPLGDFYDTRDGHKYSFTARSVVGGFFIKLLTDPACRRRWRPPVAAAATSR